MDVPPQLGAPRPDATRHVPDELLERVLAFVDATSWWRGSAFLVCRRWLDLRDRASATRVRVWTLNNTRINFSAKRCGVPTFDCCFHPRALALADHFEAYRDQVVHTAIDSVEQLYARNAPIVHGHLYKLSRSYHFARLYVGASSSGEPRALLVDAKNEEAMKEATAGDLLDVSPSRREGTAAGTPEPRGHLAAPLSLELLTRQLSWFDDVEEARQQGEGKLRLWARLGRHRIEESNASLPAAVEALKAEALPAAVEAWLATPGQEAIRRYLMKHQRCCELLETWCEIIRTTATTLTWDEQYEDSSPWIKDVDVPCPLTETQNIYDSRESLTARWYHKSVRKCVRRCCIVCGWQRKPCEEPFQLCDGCGGMRYCSEACQRLHWDAGHKDHCAQIIYQTKPMNRNGLRNIDKNLDLLVKTTGCSRDVAALEYYSLVHSRELSGPAILICALASIISNGACIVPPVPLKKAGGASLLLSQMRKIARDRAKDFKLTDDVMQKIEEMPLPRCQKIEFAKFKASAMFFRHHDPCEFAYHQEDALRLSGTPC